VTDLSRWSRFLAFVLTLGLAAEASGQVWALTFDGRRGRLLLGTRSAKHAWEGGAAILTGFDPAAGRWLVVARLEPDCDASPTTPAGMSCTGASTGCSS